jgi:hypothetical protein
MGLSGSQEKQQNITKTGQQKKATESYISHEGMQTKSSLCLQNPSMIHKTNREKISGQGGVWVVR